MWGLFQIFCLTYFEKCPSKHNCNVTSQTEYSKGVLPNMMLCVLPNMVPMFIYRTRTIISRGLYTFLPHFKRPFMYCDLWPYVWLIFKSGLWWRAYGICFGFCNCTCLKKTITKIRNFEIRHTQVNELPRTKGVIF